MEDYQVLGCVGEGAHGVVLRARCRTTDRAVALKKIPVVCGNITRSMLREIMALRHLQHENIARLERVVAGSGSLVLVLELLDRHLGQIIYGMPPLSEAETKGYLKMLLKGLRHCHSQGILHRDLKPSNLLVDRRGCLKIADFGLACLKPEGGAQSHRVATRWYRAPELLYGAERYGEGVDIWSVGCILAEMLGRRPLFKGETDIEQLCVVVQALGTPNEDVWPGVETLPDYRKIHFAPQKGRPLADLLPDCPGPHTLDLVGRFLIYDPDRRIACDEALKHPYLLSEPLPFTPPCCSAAPWMPRNRVE